MHKLLVTLLFLPAFCFAQKDYCKRIKKQADNNTLTINFNSPVLKHLSVIKQYYLGNFSFSILLHLETPVPAYDATGVGVTFDDGKTIKDDQAHVECREQSVTVSSDGRYQQNSDGYLLQGFLVMNDGNIAQFMSHKIVSIQLNKNTMNVSEKEATDIINYITCMKDMAP